MTRTIALCGVPEKIACALVRHGGCQLLRFGDDAERRGDVKLAYFLRHGPAPDLILVGYPGAGGLAACDYLRTQDSTLPILWICDREEFKPEARRLDVSFYGTGPPDAEQAVSAVFKALK